MDPASSSYQEERLPGLEDVQLIAVTGYGQEGSGNGRAAPASTIW